MRLTPGRRALALAAALLFAACTQPTGPVPTVQPPAPPTGDATATATVPRQAGSLRMEWSRIPDIPTPRSEVAAVYDGEHVYVIGGFGGTNVVERYDPLNRRWEKAPDLPIGVDHPMAAAVKGPNSGIYVIGGNSSGRPSARMFRLAPAATGWEEMPPMPRPRSAGAAVPASLGSQGLVPPLIAVVGGASDAGLEAATLVYDTILKTWSSRAPIPTPRDHLAAIFLDGRVCAVGGRALSMSRNLAALECWDPGADTWEQLPPPPTARGGVGAAQAAKRLFFIGGEQPSGTFPHVEIYDLATRSWSRGPDLPTPRHGIGVVTIGVPNGEGILVLTGGPTPGGSQTAVCELLTITTVR